MNLDAIYCGTSAHMSAVDDESVQLVVTSPPYNVDKGYETYDDNRSLKEYLDLLDDVWRECYRVLAPGGRIAINVANTDRRPYIPLNAHITGRMLKLGFLMRGEIIWDKGPSVGVSTAWGSFARASNPVLRDVHEYIMVFCKEDFKLPSKGRRSGITNADFVEWTKSVWHFPTENAKRLGHPAPFPEELPRRLILLYTNIGDVVLDPFMGSGSTAVAAKKLQRHYVGYDLSESYCDLARQRLIGTPEPLLPFDGDIDEEPEAGSDHSVETPELGI